MPWLFIDTHTRGAFRFGLISSPEKNSVKEYAGSSALLLPKLLQACRKEMKSVMTKKPLVAGLCVVSGPGSFSSVRTGVLYGNMLARLGHLPLVGVMADEAEDLSALAISLFNKTRASVTYVAPVYDAEPNITIPKTV